MSQPYLEGMDICPSVTYISCVKCLREQTGNTITLAHFEEGDLWYETLNNEESVDESDDDSIMPALLIEEDMDVMDSGDESDNDPIFTEMLEDIYDLSQSHLNVNWR